MQTNVPVSGNFQAHRVISALDIYLSAWNNLHKTKLANMRDVVVVLVIKTYVAQ